MKCISCGKEIKQKRFPVNKMDAVKCRPCFIREDCEPMTGSFGVF